MNDESPETSDSFILEIASEAHVGYAEQISKMLEESDKAFGIGKRPLM